MIIIFINKQIKVNKKYILMFYTTIPYDVNIKNYLYKIGWDLYETQALYTLIMTKSIMYE